MIVAIDAGGVAVGEADGDGVAAYLRCGLRSRLGLEHRQRGEGGTPWSCRSGEGFFLAAFVVARGARAFFP